ncbi:uncharacterized protein Dana_GF17567 [Drosophila ananassae]|uniref:CHK kinase-like domain-containing protein n=1 Tax=Drosophila ananassae TaxID=7217 RepID=B3LWK9_DROAN|nr:uncharacterized protein LOC6500351 [Drosophila ananassae]EDV41603.1 uncharacterized protein Dana_GF17567 [Drosophila ananassae]
MSENEGAEHFYEDELVAPSWLNTEFIEGVLRSHEKAPELEVTDLKITPGSTKGDHYASVMFRTTAEYTTMKGKFTKPLILKTVPDQEGHKKDMLSNSHLFATEIGMYSKVLPEFEKILREAGDSTKLFVPCVYHSMEPRPVLIFEDLVPQGYAVIRDRPMTPEEQTAIFTKLAKWHAVSMKVINEQPDFLRDFKYSLFDMPNFMTGDLVITGMENFVEMLSVEPELTKYTTYFSKIQDTYLSQMLEEVNEFRNNWQPDGHYVLCHGDFHHRNMMFRHNKNSGAVEDVMFVDFQVCTVSPSSVDLLCAVYRLLEPERRCELGKDEINLYFSVLEDTLKKVDYKGEFLTQAGLWQGIHRHKNYDYFMMSTFLPMILAEKSNAFKMDDLVKSNDFRKKAFFLDVYQKEIKKLLPKFEELGYFDDI